MAIRPIPELTDEQAARFHASYDRVESGCWIWNRSVSANGYGSISLGSALKSSGPHRVSYFLHYGIQPDALCVCHTCDTPLCVNPEHLWLGTKGDNNRDMYAKGRGASGHGGSRRGWVRRRPGPYNRGEENPRAKLTEQAVRAIRTSTLNNRVLAERFGVRASAISAVKHGRTWKHLA